MLNGIDAEVVDKQIKKISQASIHQHLHDIQSGRLLQRRAGVTGMMLCTCKSCCSAELILFSNVRLWNFKINNQVYGLETSKGRSSQTKLV